MTKILFISTRNISNSFEPRNYTLGVLLAGLAENNNVVLMSPEFAPTALSVDQDQRQYLLNLEYKALRISKGIGLALKSLSNIFRLRPIQCALFDNHYNNKIYMQVLSEYKPDVIIFDYVRAYPFFWWLNQGTRPLTIIDVGDLLSARYCTLLKARDTAGVDYFGYAKKYIPKYFQYLARIAGRVVLKYEALAVGKLEEKTVLDFDSVVLVSRSEVELLVKKCKYPNKVRHIPFATATRRNVLDIAPEHRMAKIGYFIGNYAYAPNLFAVRFILEKVLPSLEGYIFKIIGPSLPSNLQCLAQGLPHVEYLGYVDDLYSATADCGFLLAPVAAGSGVSSKILEAVANGVFVVTNELGARPLQEIGLTTVLVAEELDGYVSAFSKIQTIFDDRNKYFLKDIEQLERYSAPHMVVSAWEELIEGLMTSKFEQSKGCSTAASSGDQS